VIYQRLKNISSIAQEYFWIRRFINCSRIFNRLLKNISGSGDLSIVQEYLFIRWFNTCSRIFLHQVIYRLLKNMSSSGDLSTAQEYFCIRWIISCLRIFTFYLQWLYTAEQEMKE
jgi:hypothetical protein